MFLDLAILDALYEDRTDGNLFAGWRQALKATTLGSTPCCQGNYLVSFSDLILNDKLSVTECH